MKLPQIGVVFPDSGSVMASMIVITLRMSPAVVSTKYSVFYGISTSSVLYVT